MFDLEHENIKPGAEIVHGIGNELIEIGVIWFCGFPRLGKDVDGVFDIFAGVPKNVNDLRAMDANE